MAYTIFPFTVVSIIVKVVTVIIVVAAIIIAFFRNWKKVANRKSSLPVTTVNH